MTPTLTTFGLFLAMSFALMAIVATDGDRAALFGGALGFACCLIPWGLVFFLGVRRGR